MSRSGRLFSIVAIIVVVAIMAATGLAVAPGPAAPRGGATTVVLEAGSGLPGVARQLRGAGVIRSRLLFMVVAEAIGAAPRLQAGEYAFPSRAPMVAIVEAIRQGRVVRHFLTIPEGFTTAQAVEVLRRAGELAGPVSAPAEGSLLPETYQVIRGETRAHVLRRMMADRDTLLMRLWDHRRADLPYRSPEEAVILASIVEKETAIASERPRIAAVFLNRLSKGMRLESDPTVVYGLTGGAPLGHGLRVSELASRTPFNTYAVSGLPPTPIANPGRAALQAVFAPAPGADLYFVADGTGGHVFSVTLAQHLRNVAHWRSIELAQRSPAGGDRAGLARP